MRTTILWFRKDLRLQDNRALAEAIETGQAIIPVYIWAPQEEGSWAPGAASNWWLHHALEDLDAQLREIGLRLLVRDARGQVTQARRVDALTGHELVVQNTEYDALHRISALSRPGSGTTRVPPSSAASSR